MSSSSSSSPPDDAIDLPPTKQKAPKAKRPRPIETTPTETTMETQIEAPPAKVAKRPTKKSLAADAAAAADAARKLLPPPPTPSEILAARRELARSKWLETIVAFGGVTESTLTTTPTAHKERRLASALEKCVFNYAVLAAREKSLLIHPGCPVFWNMYVARARTLQRNFQRNPAFLRSVCSGALAPQDLQSMSTVEFDLDHWRVQLDAKSKRTASQFETRLVANTSAYTCEHCGSKQCTYYELQLRSSDEPATIFVTCIDCGHRWSD